MKYILEIIAFNIESCRIIENCGAHRIELCDNPGEGGTTPSYGLLKKAREITGIELFPIIRPRGGDFLYNDEEFEIILADIKKCRELGMDGIVTGMLTRNAEVDKERCKKIASLAYPMELCFHRAFDRVKNAEESLEDIIECGFQRVLTSGLHPAAMEGIDNITAFVKQAGDRITIMPGSGIRPENIESIARSTGATHFHSSARTTKPSFMKYISQSMKEELKQVIADEVEIRAMLDVLHKLETSGNV